MTAKGECQMKNNHRKFTAAITLMIVGSMLLCILILVGCNSEVQTGNGKNEPASENTGAALENQDEDETPESPGTSDKESADTRFSDDTESVSSETVSAKAEATNFIRGMGCDDTECTDPSHYHDCPADCDNYDHYHHCDLNCRETSHNHHLNVKPVESDKVA